jgi:hypothetical protein
MRRQTLKQSELIQSIGYKDGQMEIKYRDDGAVFIYSGVSEGLYKALLRSPHPRRGFSKSQGFLSAQTSQLTTFE